MLNLAKQIVLVSGENGQLGKCLFELSENFRDTQFYFLGRKQFALQDFEAMQTAIQRLKPTVVINTAAYTAVDKAELESAMANLINGEAVGVLADLCRKAGARFLHVSTDYVFDGNAKMPYQETDTADPVNTYGASKLKGEELAMSINPNAIIIRTSWIYSRHGSNFVKTMLRLMAQKSSIGVVADQFGCATYAIDLAEAILKIVHLSHWQPGIYHFSNSGPISWFQFAEKIAALTHSLCMVSAISTNQYPTPAKRPAFSALCNNKIKEVYGISQNNWEDSLAICLSSM